MITATSWSEILLWLHLMATLICALRVLYFQKKTGVALAWLVVLILTPVVGVVAYFLVGETRLGRARLRRKQELTQFYQDFSREYVAHGLPRAVLPSPWQSISDIASHATGFTVNSGHQCQFLNQTDAILAAMVVDIHQAQRTVVLMFYIIEPKGQVAHVLEAVLSARERGVHCEIMADGLGSASFFKSAWYERLRQAGVLLHQSLPVGLLKTLLVRSDLRNHRKMLVVDEHVAYTGSYNLVDSQVFKQSSDVGQWVDMVVRVEGAVVLHLLAMFYADVAVERQQDLLQVQNWWRNRGDFVQLATQRLRKTGSLIQLIPSAPHQSHTVFYDVLIAALYQAQHNIVISTPYFVPDDALLLALTTAARRKVSVFLIVPAKVDSFLVRHASLAYFRELLDSGVHIAQFQDGLLHTKSVVIDESVAFFGTVNMDMRSFYLNLELTLALYSVADIRVLAAQQQHYLQDSILVDAQAWKHRSVPSRLLENVVRLLGPLL